MEDQDYRGYTTSRQDLHRFSSSLVGAEGDDQPHFARQ